jgi:hypothetical protein
VRFGLLLQRGFCYPAVFQVTLYQYIFATLLRQFLGEYVIIMQGFYCHNAPEVLQVALEMPRDSKSYTTEMLLRA